MRTTALKIPYWLVEVLKNCFTYEILSFCFSFAHYSPYFNICSLFFYFFFIFRTYISHSHEESKGILQLIALVGKWIFLTLLTYEQPAFFSTCSIWLLYIFSEVFFIYIPCVHLHQSRHGKFVVFFFLLTFTYEKINLRMIREMRWRRKWMISGWYKKVTWCEAKKRIWFFFVIGFMEYLLRWSMFTYRVVC